MMLFTVEYDSVGVFSDDVPDQCFFRYVRIDSVPHPRFRRRPTCRPTDPQPSRISIT